MQVHTNEQEVKGGGQFLKLTDKSVFTIESHLITIMTSYINSIKNSVLWDDALVQKGEVRRQEFYYWGKVGGEEGIIRVPATVFFAINEAERITGNDKRGSEWIVGKTGEGKATKYSVVRGKDVSVEESVVEENTKKLTEILSKYESSLKTKLDEFLGNSENEPLLTDEEMAEMEAMHK